MADIDEEAADGGTLVALGVDAGLRTKECRPILSNAFEGVVDSETLVAVIEMLEKGKVL